MSEQATGTRGPSLLPQGVLGVLVNVDVDDLAAAERFYTSAFGLRVGRRLGEDMTELLGAAVPLYLLKKAAGSAATPQGGAQRDYARHWPPVHVDLVVGDVDAALARAKRAGATVEEGVTEHAYGRLALLSDPFGHGICLLEFNHNGYDAITTE